MSITKVISEILTIVKYYFRITYDEESMTYYRFIVHVRSFARRLFSGTTYGDAHDIELLQQIQTKYQEAATCAGLVETYMMDHYDYMFQSEELLYLTIHIEKVIRDSQK